MIFDYKYFHHYSHPLLGLLFMWYFDKKLEIKEENYLFIFFEQDCIDVWRVVAIKNSCFWLCFLLLFLD
jgi:hypothetical protein